MQTAPLNTAVCVFALGAEEGPFACCCRSVSSCCWRQRKLLPLPIELGEGVQALGAELVPRHVLQHGGAPPARSTRAAWRQVPPAHCAHNGCRFPCRHRDSRARLGWVAWVRNGGPERLSWRSLGLPDPPQRLRPAPATVLPSYRRRVEPSPDVAFCERLPLRPIRFVLGELRFAQVQVVAVNVSL